MKQILLSLVTLFAFTASNAQLQINPQIGLTLMSFTNPPAGTDFKADPGLMIGADARFGERFQLQPGLFYMATKTVISVDGVTEETDLERSLLRIKLLGAYNFIDGDEFKFRINAGPSYDFLLSAKDGDEDVKDLYKSGSFNLQGGLGIDFLFLTADLGYAYGLTEIFDFEGASNSKQAGFYFTVGVIFGSGKK